MNLIVVLAIGRPLLIRLQSTFDLCQAVTRNLKNYPIAFDPRPALGVVLASQGYPENYAKGQVIEGSTHTVVDGKIFHAGQRKTGRSSQMVARFVCTPEQ